MSAKPETTGERAGCPFCGSTDISDGEVMTEHGGAMFTQSECQGCGALGPRAKLANDEPDYGDEKAIAAWNTRALLAADGPTCKHCNGKGYTKAGEYLASCICQMTPEQFAHQVSVWAADGKAGGEVVREDSEEAAEAIQAMLKEYGYPSNPTNAARAGWRACRLHTRPQQAAQMTDWRDGVNVARLRAALTRMGVATEPSEEGTAADLENWVNTLTRAVATGQQAAQVAQPPILADEINAFSEWFDAVWMGDQEHGQYIPTNGDPEYSDYLDKRQIALGAWVHRAKGIGKDQAS